MGGESPQKVGQSSSKYAPGGRADDKTRGITPVNVEARIGHFDILWLGGQWSERRPLGRPLADDGQEGVSCLDDGLESVPCV